MLSDEFYPVSNSRPTLGHSDRGSCDGALTTVTSSEWAAHAFGKTLLDVIDRHNRTEIGLMVDLSKEEICAPYRAAYYWLR